MVQFQYEGRLTLGDDIVDLGLTDLQVVSDASGGPVLIAVSRGAMATNGATDGATVAWDLTGADLPTLNGVREGDFIPRAGQSPAITTFDTGSGPSVMLTGFGGTGFGGTGVGIAAIDGAGRLGVIGDADIPAGIWTAAVQVGANNLALAGADGLTLVNMANGWVVQDTLRDTDEIYAGAATRMASVTVNGTDILLVASGAEGGLSSFTVTRDGLDARDGLGMQDGTGLMSPTDIAGVTLDGATYAIVASAAGTSGVITVLDVSQDGDLTQTDQVFDTRDTRFGAVQSIAVQPFGNGALIVAGGGDDGLTLLALSSTGVLVHLGSLPDTVQTGLTNVVSLEMTITGDTVDIYATSQADAGVSVFSVDLSGFGDILSPSTGGGTIRGGARDDVLVGTTGQDAFYGGDGADTFVIVQNDGPRDAILNFDPTEDRIDLSGWSFLYDVDALIIWSSTRGTRIRLGDQLLEVRGPGNTPIDVDALRAAIDIDVNRLPTLVQITRMGDNADNIIEGSWGMDTLSGGAGNDTIFGDDGDDMILADAGDDLVFGGNGHDTYRMTQQAANVEVIAHDGQSVTLQSDQGRDVITGVEYFVFDDATLTLDQMAFLNEPMVLTGTNGNDVLEYTAGDVRILGNDGDDTITAGGGADVLKGGNGNDTIRGGHGDDLIYGQPGHDQAWGSAGDDLIFGGAGHDFLRGGNDVDILHGHDGADILSGQRHGDTIYGGNDDDRIFGGGGNDTVFGGAGDDFLKGGARRDVLHGGSGDDIINGNSFPDELYGGDGNDVLRGGQADDILQGGRGRDFLKGGTGNDTFVFNRGDGADTIIDFDPERDTLALSDSILSGLSVSDAVQTYGVQTNDGVMLDFGAGDTILLRSVNALSDLPAAIDVWD